MAKTTGGMIALESKGVDGKGAKRDMKDGK
jgi:hypothetical protein